MYLLSIMWYSGKYANKYMVSGSILSAEANVMLLYLQVLLIHYSVSCTFNDCVHIASVLD